MRTISIILCAIILSGCPVDLSAPDPNFSAVDASILGLGMWLGFDQVDGGYTVYAEEATDQSISKAVQALKELQHEKSIRFAFFLSNTNVTDAAIKDIATLQITRLRIDGTRVTDTSLVVLRESKFLCELVVEETQFTKEAVHDFKEARPDVEVRDPY